MFKSTKLVERIDFAIYSRLENMEFLWLIKSFLPRALWAFGLMAAMLRVVLLGVAGPKSAGRIGPEEPFQRFSSSCDSVPSA